MQAVRSLSRILRILGADRTLHECCRRDDRDAPKGIQDQQIGIAGHDHIRMAIHREFEKLVVGRVAASDDALGNRHRFPPAP
jgi:hypothetical protein